jgi:hypothetical protein
MGSANWRGLHLSQCGQAFANTLMSQVSLFDEMDTIADAVRSNNPDLREGLSDELQLEFRQLQKRRCPELSKQ